MKIKLIVTLLIGLFVGALLGSVLFGQSSATTYDELYYLNKINSSLNNIEMLTRTISYDTDAIKDALK